ncbi:hypothetical protein SprV_0902657600 [Sparganum proliferum]
MAVLILFAAGSGLIWFGVHQLQIANLREAALCVESMSDNHSTGTGSENAKTPDLPTKACNTCCMYDQFKGRILTGSGVALLILCLTGVLLILALTLQNKQIIRSIGAPPPCDVQEGSFSAI